MTKPDPSLLDEAISPQGHCGHEGGVGRVDDGRRASRARIDNQVVNDDLPFDRHGHAARTDLRHHRHILNSLGVARRNAGTGAKVKLCIGVDQKDRAMNSPPCCLGDVAECIRCFGSRSPSTRDGFVAASPDKGSDETARSRRGTAASATTPAARKQRNTTDSRLLSESTPC